MSGTWRPAVVVMLVLQGTAALPLMVVGAIVASPGLIFIGMVMYVPTAFCLFGLARASIGR